MREEATPWSSAAFAAAAGITAAAWGLTSWGGGQFRSRSKAERRATPLRWICRRIHVVAFFTMTWGTRSVIARRFVRMLLTPRSAFLRNARRSVEGASSERAALTSIWCLAPNLPAAATMASPSLRSASGPAERNMVATRDCALERATTRGAEPVARTFAEAMVADILIGGGTMSESCVRLCVVGASDLFFQPVSEVSRANVDVASPESRKRRAHGLVAKF